MISLDHKMEAVFVSLRKLTEDIYETRSQEKREKLLKGFVNFLYEIDRIGNQYPPLEPDKREGSYDVH